MVGKASAGLVSVGIVEPDDQIEGLARLFGLVEEGITVIPKDCRVSGLDIVEYGPGISGSDTDVDFADETEVSAVGLLTHPVRYPA